MATASQIKIDRSHNGSIKSITIKPSKSESQLDEIIDALIYEDSKNDEKISLKDAKKQLESYFKRKKNEAKKIRSEQFDDRLFASQIEVGMLTKTVEKANILKALGR